MALSIMRTTIITHMLTFIVNTYINTPHPQKKKKKKKNTYKVSCAKLISCT
jgi:hypothetical protein